jgi:hypothetical protein
MLYIENTGVSAGDASLSSASSRIGCEGENMLPRVANFVATCKSISGCATSARVGHRLTFTRQLPNVLAPMIKPKPPRYQALIERSITARGSGTETYYVIDSRTNARIVKCRNQQESEKIATGLNAAAKFRWVKFLSDGSVCHAA